MTLEEHYERKRLEGISQGIEMSKKELRAILDKGKAEGLTIEEVMKRIEEFCASE